MAVAEVIHPLRHANGRIAFSKIGDVMRAGESHQVAYAIPNIGELLRAISEIKGPDITRLHRIIEKAEDHPSDPLVPDRMLEGVSR